MWRASTFEFCDTEDPAARVRDGIVKLENVIKRARGEVLEDMEEVPSTEDQQQP